MMKIRAAVLYEKKTPFQIETPDLAAPKVGAGRIIALDTNPVKDELARGAIVFPSL